jgi:hypothetical protein
VYKAINDSSSAMIFQLPYVLAGFEPASSVPVDDAMTTAPSPTAKVEMSFRNEIVTNFCGLLQRVFKALAANFLLRNALLQIMCATQLFHFFGTGPFIL